MPNVANILKKAGRYVMNNKIKTGAGAVNTFFAYDSYKTSREQGDSAFTAVATAMGDLALMSTMGLISYMGVQAAMFLPGAAMSAYETGGQYARSLARQGKNVPFGNATFVDTEQAYTMRQAGQMLLKRGEQSILGREAQSLHR